MRYFSHRRANLALSAAIAALSLAGICSAQPKPGAPADTQVARAVGTIKIIRGNSITVIPDSGGEITATLAASTKILRVPPGEKDLKNAVPITAQDLQPGDRVLVRGQASADGRSIAALAVIVMKQGDLSAKQQREREDWQKRGVGGLVDAVDATSGTITISSGSFGASRTIAVHTTKSTVLRRYAPNSVKFDDAKPAPLDQIKPGDQLRARGTRSPESELAAEEIVSGAFRNIAGTILAIDTAASTVTVQDTIGKTAIMVKVSADSQLKKLPQEFAQRIAMRLKGSAGGNGDHGAGPEASPPSKAGPPPDTGSQMARGPGATQNGNGNGSPDLQRILSRLANSSLADLQKGDAVMIVSTQGGDSETVTAITLLSGVESILTAAPSRSASILSPWSLSAPSGEGEAAQ